MKSMQEETINMILQFDILIKNEKENLQKIRQLEGDLIKRELKLSEQSLYVRAMKFNIYDFESQLCTV